MLLFDSDLLCVDGLVDADSLWRGVKKGQKRRGERSRGNKSAHSFFTHSKKKQVKFFILKLDILPPFRKLPFPFSNHLGNERQPRFFYNALIDPFSAELVFKAAAERPPLCCWGGSTASKETRVLPNLSMECSRQVKLQTCDRACKKGRNGAGAFFFFFLILLRVCVNSQD